MNGVDLTRQATKDTQIVIDEVLGIGDGLLHRCCFFGQHSHTLKSLLGLSDQQLKAELKVLVDTSLWVAANEHVRSRKREAKSRLSAIDVESKIRLEEVTRNEHSLAQEERSKDALETQLEEATRALNNSLAVSEDPSLTPLSMGTGLFNKSLSELNQELNEIQTALETLQAIEITPLRHAILEAVRSSGNVALHFDEKISALREQIASVRASLHAAQSALDAAKRKLQFSSKEGNALRNDLTVASETFQRTVALMKSAEASEISMEKAGKSTLPAKVPVPSAQPAPPANPGPPVRRVGSGIGTGIGKGIGGINRGGYNIGQSVGVGRNASVTNVNATATTTTSDNASTLPQGYTALSTQDEGGLSDEQTSGNTASRDAADLDNRSDRENIDEWTAPFIRSKQESILSKLASVDVRMKTITTSLERLKETLKEFDLLQRGNDSATQEAKVACDNADEHAKAHSSVEACPTCGQDLPIEKQREREKELAGELSELKVRREKLFVLAGHCRILTDLSEKLRNMREKSESLDTHEGELKSDIEQHAATVAAGRATLSELEAQCDAVAEEKLKAMLGQRADEEAQRSKLQALENKEKEKKHNESILKDAILQVILKIVDDEL